jgi:hypothetical protein
MIKLSANMNDIRRIADDLAQAHRLFDFTNPRNQKFAAKFQEITGATLYDEFQNGRDPDGIAFAPLSPKYAQWKAVVAPGKPIGTLSGAMGSHPALQGTMQTSSDRLTISYAGDAYSQYKREAFESGQFAHGSGPPRQFFFIGTKVQAKIDAHCEQHLNAWPT